MNEVCWYSNSYTWNREKLMDPTKNECGVKYKCPSMLICKPCQSRKTDFHDRLKGLERKWKKKEVSINSQ